MLQRSGLDWYSVLQPLTDEEIIDGSYQKYLRDLVAQDLEKRLYGIDDELQKITIMDALRAIHEAERIEPKKQKIKKLRTDLSKLKKKHRQKLKNLKKNLIDDLSY